MSVLILLGNIFGFLEVTESFREAPGSFLNSLKAFRSPHKPPKATEDDNRYTFHVNRAA